MGRDGVGETSIEKSLEASGQKIDGTRRPCTGPGQGFYKTRLSRISVLEFKNIHSL